MKQLSWGILSTPSLPLFPGSLWPVVITSDWVPSMGQIEISNHFLDLKLSNCMQQITDVKLSY